MSLTGVWKFALENWGTDEKLQLPDEEFIATGKRHFFNYTEDNPANGFKRASFKTGISEFVINNAKDKISRRGNPMTVLNLNLTDSGGNRRKTNFYVVKDKRYDSKMSEIALSVKERGVFDSLRNLRNMTGRCESAFQYTEHGIELVVRRFLPKENLDVEKLT